MENEYPQCPSRIYKSKNILNSKTINEIKVSTENVHKAFHAAGENPAIQELLINLSSYGLTSTLSKSNNKSGGGEIALW